MIYIISLLMKRQFIRKFRECSYLEMYTLL